jgi:NTE family protein
MKRSLRADLCNTMAPGTKAVITSSESALSNLAAASSAFGDLSPKQQAEIWSWARVRPLLSGETLVLQNTAADAIFVVVAGRFEVRVEGKPIPLAEIGVGQPIGEIAFFAGGLRTATVIAVRDSMVLELDRASFEQIGRRVPAIYDQLLASLARRLAETTARVTGSIRLAAARTIAIVAAGYADIPAKFFRRFQDTFTGSGKCLFLSHAALKERFPNLNLDDARITNWLNSIESEYDLIVYQADPKPTEWSRKAIRQADQIVLLAYGSATGGCEVLEQRWSAFRNKPTVLIQPISSLRTVKRTYNVFATPIETKATLI